MYIVDKNNVLFKYNEKGMITRKYSPKKYGQLHSIDPRNPLNIICYFKDLNHIIVIDNELSYKEEISMLDYSITQSSAVAYSFDGNYWVFDQDRSNLIKINQNAIISESGNIEQIIGYSVQATQIEEADKWVYLNTIENGILVFDLYGNYYKTIPIKTTNKFQIKEKKIFYINNNQLQVYDTETLENNAINTANKELIDFKIGHNRLFLLSKNNVVLQLLN